MSPKRLYYTQLGLIALLFIGLLGGAYGINSLLSTKAQQLTSLKAKNQALEREQSSLTLAQKEVAKYADLEQIAKSIVPEDKDQAEAVREIVNIAAANGISLSSITFPASSLGNTQGASSSQSSSTTPTTPTAKVSPKTGKLSQLQPVKNIPGVYVLQITVKSNPDQPVSYASFINFLNDLEQNRRTAQISSISLQPNSKNSNLLTFTIVLNEYIKP